MRFIGHVSPFFQRLSDYSRSIPSLLFATMLLPHLLGAATYYVATNGSNSNPGSSTAPVLTLQRGVDLAASGDTVIVRDGTYGHASCTAGTDSMAVWIGKTNLVIKAENKWRAILDGESICFAYFSFSTGASNVTIQDFIIRNATQGGIWSNQSADHLNIIGNKIEYIGNRYETSNIGIDGIFTNSTTTDVLFKGNVVHHIGRTGGTYMWHDQGMYLHGKNYTIVDNLFYSITSGWAITPVTGDNYLIANNTFAFPNPIRDGFICPGDGALSNITIRNNIFYQPTGGALVNCAVLYSGTNSFDHNIIYGPSQMVGPDVCGGSTGLNTISISNNLFLDPLLVNVGAYDFHLQPNSPAIDAGVAVPSATPDFDGTPRPQGSGYDMGAYEYTSGVAASTFSLAASPATLSVQQGTASNATVAATLLTGTAQTVSLAASSLPAGVTASFSSPVCTLSCSSNLVLTAASTAATGTYKIAINGNDGGYSTSTSVNVTVSAAPAPFTFSLASSPTSLSIPQGASGNSAITATLLTGTSQGVTFSASSLPTGVSASFSNPVCNVTCSTTLVLSTSSTTPAGSYNLVVTGNGGGYTASASIGLTVSPVTITSTPTTYYVATNGSDANPGTSAAPVLTLQRGVDLAGPGDTVIVRNGSYGHAGCASNNDFAVNVTKSGTASANIILKAENKWGAILDAESICHSYINLGTGAAYLSIQGFVIRNGYWGGIWSNQNAHDIAIKGNRIENIGNRAESSTAGMAGIYTNSTSNSFTIAGNVIHDIGRTSGAYMWNDNGIDIRGNNYTIVNNVLYKNTSGWAITPVGPMDNVLIANNTFAFPNPIRDGHIVIGSGAISNITIRNNVFYQPSGSAIVHCAVQYSGTNSFDHNIAYGPSQVVGGDICGTSTGLSTIMQANNTIGNPALVNTSTAPYDFHLQPGSPAIDAGVAVSSVTSDIDGTPRPQGAGYDLGAYEYTPTVTAAPFTFSLAASPTTLSVQQGTTSSSNITATLLTGTAQSVSLAASSLPAGVTASFSNPVCTVTCSASLVLTASSTATPGTYNVAVLASGGGYSASTSINLTVTAAPAPAPTAFTFSLGDSPSSLSIRRGGSGKSAITATLLTGTPQGVAFSTSSLPQGVSASFSSPVCTATCSTNLVLSVSSTAKAGTYNVVVTGNGGGATSSTAITLGVTRR